MSLTRLICNMVSKRNMVQHNAHLLQMKCIQYYLNNESNVYVTLLDASQAFDRVNYVKLFRLLRARKLPAVILRFLIVFYTNQNIRVRWRSSISISCTISNGVKQGGVLSPILFTIYIDELLNELRKSGLGCHIGQQFCGSLGYADDVLLLAPTLFSLRKMLDICSKYATSYNVLFNASKSKLLYFGQAASRPTLSPVNFMGATIELVSHEKHLGNVIGQNCIKYKIEDCINIFTGRTNMIRTHFCHARYDVIYDIFKTYCMPLYGSQLWDYGDRNTDRFYVNWRKAVRKLFNLPNRTHSALLPYICDDVNPFIQLLRRVISFNKGLSNTENELSALCYKLAMQGSGSATSNNISIMSFLWSVPREDVHSIKRNICPEIFNNEVAICASVVRDLLNMKHINKYFHNNVLFNNEEIDFMVHILCTQ